MVFACSRSGFRNSSRCLWSSTWKFPRLENGIQEHSDWTRPGCFGLKDRSSEGTGGRAASARSSSRPPSGRRGSAAGPTQPESTSLSSLIFPSQALIIACLVDAHVSQQPLFMLPRLQRSTQTGLGFIHMDYFSRVFLIQIPEHTSCSSDRESAEWFCNSLIGSAQGGDLAIQSERQHICFHLF